jgi:hypothetical protein
MSNEENSKPEDRDRRGADRPTEDTGWEAKVLGRLSRRVTEALEPSSTGETQDLGWEQKSLELLRNRIKRTRD